MKRFPSKTAAAWYLSAMTDGEGHVQFGPKWNAGIILANTDPSLVAAMTDACDVLGIGYIRYLNRWAKKPKWRPMWFVAIGRWAEIYKFAELVPLQSIAKRARLASMIEQHKQMRLARYAPRPKPDELARLYFEERLTTKQIAERLACSPTSVLNWLRRDGRAIRPRGNGSNQRALRLAK